MNIDEALSVIDSVCAQVQLNREGHLKIQQAINVVKMALPAKEPETEET